MQSFKNMNQEKSGPSAIILYHKEDNDGVYSGAIIRNHCLYDLRLQGENITCVGLDYAETKKFDKTYIDDLAKTYDLLFVTDISFDVDLMEYCYEKFDVNFIWLDHHAPVIKAANEKYDAENRWNGLRKTDRSAILCAFSFLYDRNDEIYKNTLIKRGQIKIPNILWYLSAWDSFTFDKVGLSLDFVRGFNKAVEIETKLNILKACEIIDYLPNEEQEFINKCKNIGESIIKYERYANGQLILHSADLDWTVGEDNRLAACLILQGPSTSMIFESLKKTKIQNGIVLKYNHKSNYWTISLYNVNNKDLSFDCGKYCREIYGGGGHFGAAGCQISYEKFEEIMKTKHI